MAYLQTAHAITRIREVIGEGRGTQYTVPPGRFQDALRRGIDEGQATLRGHEAAAPFRVEFTGSARNAASPVFNRSNLQKYDVGINVVVSRSLGAAAKVDPDEAGAVTAAMIEAENCLITPESFADQVGNPTGRPPLAYAKVLHPEDGRKSKDLRAYLDLPADKQAEFHHTAPLTPENASARANSELVKALKDAFASKSA